MTLVKRLYLGLCTTVFVVGIAAVALSPWIDIRVNLTSSLPGTVYVIRKGEALQKGDLIAYRWHGGATYPANTVFIKRVVGMPADLVKRDGAAFWVAGEYIGKAKPFSRAGVPLEASQGGLVPSGEFFVATPHPDSLDSRYALSGNIKQEAVIGRAYELF